MPYSINPTDYIQRAVQFCAAQGVKIDLENPRTIQDKLMWLNIYEPNKLKCVCADKLRLRDYCLSVIGKDLCIPLIGIYNKVINFGGLPNQFVLKCNHGSGMNILVKDKSSLDEKAAINQLNEWLKMDFAFQNGFEAHYHDIQRKVFVERYMEAFGDIPYDYKISCFNGEPKFVQVIGERFNSGRHMNYYDLDFNYIPMSRLDFENDKESNDKKPEHLEEMIEYARKLSKPFKYVRVDFYEIEDRVYLGEMTFTPGACAFRYVNPEDEIKVGDMLNLNG